MTWRRAAVAATLALVVAAACADDGAGRGEGSATSACDDQLAAGTAYRHDPAFAIALSRGIEVGHPELSPIVDAVAAGQADDPDHASLDPTADGLTADASFNYVTALQVLVESPAMATPGVIDALADAAGPDGVDHAAGTGGLGGVAAVVGDPRAYVPADYDVPELVDLANAVLERREAVEDAGIVPLDTRDCTSG